jgi:GTP pyrophosphokinase
LIHSQEKSRSIELGRKLFDKEARRFDLNPKALAEGEAFGRAIGEIGLQKADDVFAAIGYGKTSARQFLARVVPPGELHEKPPNHGVASVVRRVLGTGGETIKVRGIDDVMVFRARCCNPIRGENIVGYVTRGKGVSVHSASCTNVVNLMYDPERRIDVEWDKAGDTMRYTVRLLMQVEDRKGILAAISSKIADINTNITNAAARTGDDHRGRIDLTVEIADVKHLQKVMKALRTVTGVIDIERVTK